MITVLAGGVGAARFLRGLIDVVDPASVTIIGNTGDDDEFLGLHVSPDLDTVVYTLADVVNEETGWGLAGDTYVCLEQAHRLGEETWFLLGDKDLATHIRRTRLLRDGQALSQATDAIARAFGLTCRLLPMSDDPVRTVVATDAGELSFQEYFVRRRWQDDVRSLRFDGAEQARPAPGLAIEVHYRLGHVREQLGDNDGALTAYQGAAAAADRDNPFRLSALARTAALYEARKDYARALTAYRDIMRNAKDPELVSAASDRVAQLQAGARKR